MADAAEPHPPAISAARETQRQLRALIAAGQLPAGHALIETDLAKRLAVSRPTLREALRELEADGLATRSRARGLAVRRLTRRDVQELYDIREALEALAASRAAVHLAHAEPGERAHFEGELSLWESVSASGNLVAFSEANRRLHTRVLEASGNSHLPRLLDHTLIDLFSAQLRGWIATPQVLQAANEHVLLLRALLDGNAQGAERIMRQHVRSSATTVLSLPDSAF